MSQKSDFMSWLEELNPHEDEFLQAVEEVYADLKPIIDNNEAYKTASIMERLCEPDRIISFRVTWRDDDGKVRVNRGWRVQHSNAIGPYKGGLRFHPTVNQSVLKFLAFEQTFKNALTGLPIGSGKGGADFDPDGCSEHEIMRFCQAFMTELYRHIGPNTDVPAGDINVGAREIGYLFGQYKKLTNTFAGSLTGKGLEFGGAHMRPEATGFGLVFFLDRMLKEHDVSLEGQTVVISGAGNVALHAAAKAIELGAKVLTLSNSDGYLHFEDGASSTAINDIKASDDRLDKLAANTGGEWIIGKKPWEVPCNVALPCATQNELEIDDARTLIDNDVTAVAEGANMPCTSDAVALLQDNEILFAPGKASNAGGVALSGLEMSINAAFEMGDRDQLGERLKTIMCEIHDRCVAEGGDGEIVNYARGANVAGFRKVADAMVSFGVV